MTRAEMERRLDVLERQVAALRPPAEPDEQGFAWLRWASTSELMQLEGPIERAAYGIEPTADERLAMIAIEVTCTRRLLAGEPDDVQKTRLALEARRDQTGWPR
jgi:hypothetical protein